MSAFPIFDATVARINDFDPDLHAQLVAINDNPEFRKLVNSDIDGTASKKTADAAKLELQPDFLPACQALIEKGGEVNWISARGVDKGAGNLSSVNGGDGRIGLTGNDGCEALIDGKLEHFVEPADLSALMGRLQLERDAYPLDPITVTPMGNHVLGVFVDQSHEAYDTFFTMMGSSARKLTSSTGRAYTVKKHPMGITLELVEKTGKAASVERIRAQSTKAIGVELYAGDGENDIDAQRNVNQQTFGFAYKVCKDRAAADAFASAAQRNPEDVGYVRGFIAGTDQWARLVGLVAEAL
jgi:trehalose-6-phosphatase